MHNAVFLFANRQQHLGRYDSQTTFRRTWTLSSQKQFKRLHMESRQEKKFLGSKTRFYRIFLYLCYSSLIKGPIFIFNLSVFFYLYLTLYSSWVIFSLGSLNNTRVLIRHDYKHDIFIQWEYNNFKGVNGLISFILNVKILFQISTIILVMFGINSYFLYVLE